MLCAGAFVLCGGSGLLCRAELWLRGGLLRAEVLPSPLPFVPLLPQALLRTLLRARLLRPGAELWLRARLLRAEVLPSSLPAVPRLLP